MLLLTASLLFTLLESARVSGLKASAGWSSELVTESLLAEYNIPLLERYHLFGLDAGYGGADINPAAVYSKAEALLKENSRLSVESCTLKSYQLFTDEKGQVFYELVTDYMKGNITQEAAGRIYDAIQQAETAQEEAGDMEKKRADALTDMEAAMKKPVQGDADQAEKTAEILQPLTEKPQNPIEYVRAWKDTGILTLVGVAPEKLSNAGINKAACLEERQRNKGSQAAVKHDNGWYGDILFQEYLITYLSSYTNEKENTQLSYELEYLIAGKHTDRENLAEVVTILIAIREAANYLYLQTDQIKCSEAFTLATLLVGFTGNALLVKCVQQGILAAWAFAESVSDVKSLLSGEKIPIMKSVAEWSTNVTNLNSEHTFDKSKHCKMGLSYEDYLRILLYTVTKEKKSYRAMDVIEQNLNNIAGYEQLCMDSLMSSIEMKYTYTAKPLFLSLVTVGDVFSQGYRIAVVQRDDYIGIE